jgi:crotonobetainyl-CoA:carnitine CoA-transferase CaiB-like acyl-CoA transferase
MRTMHRLASALVIASSALFGTTAMAAPVKNIILVHGFFADGSGWRGVADILKRDGFNVSVVQQPETSLADDVKATTAAVEAADGASILVGHSYGGVVITEAGNHANVAGLVYIAAFQPDAGESLLTLVKRTPPASEGVKATADGHLYFDPALFHADFAADLPAADASCAGPYPRARPVARAGRQKPWCSQNLADLGADVIKIERPGSGDDTRAWGPPYAKDADGKDTSEAAYYLAANRGKRSVTSTSPARRPGLLRELVAACDVVLENYKVGQLKRYGLDYESLKAIKPDLVYCSVTGFGQDGPYAHRAGYDFLIQGMGGLMSVTGERDDLPGGGPQKAGVALTDLMTGMYATVAVLAALTHRDRTGEGQYIDMALLDVQVAMLANMGSNYLNSGKPPKRWGNAHANIVPYQTFACADGHIIVATGNDGQYQKFVEVGGRAELGVRPRFATNPLRVQNRDVLVPLLAEMVADATARRMDRKLEAVGVPCGPINDLGRSLQANPQVQARGMAIGLPHPTAGKVKLVRSPMKMSATPADSAVAPPLLGQHTDGGAARGAGPQRRRDRRLAGFLLYDRQSNDNPGEYGIYRFMVDHAQQGKGIGRAAMALLLDELKAKPDVRLITICYKPDNLAASRFYQSFGFEETGLDEIGEMIAVIRP